MTHAFSAPDISTLATAGSATSSVAPQSGSVTRSTRETTIRALLTLDAPTPAQITTGIGFLDHMLTALASHARWSLSLTCNGDLHLDDHHTVEDCAIVLGQCLDQALADRTNLTRFASAYAPLDDALARATVDLATRPFASIDLGLRREMIGELSCENLPHFFTTFAINARMTLHIDVLKGINDHHRAEAAFKALAFALRQACTVDTSGSVSTKGML